MITPLNLTAVLGIGILVMISAVSMGVYMYKQAKASE